jgi:hypothetical protein
MPGGLLTSAIYWTGIGYVLIMTVCDLFALTSYNRLCRLQLNLDSTPESEKAAAEENQRELLQTLGEFKRMIFYVDVPILIGVFIVTAHKFKVLVDPSGYYLGFVAGTIAMHTVLANIISLVIAFVPDSLTSTSPTTNSSKP